MTPGQPKQWAPTSSFGYYLAAFVGGPAAPLWLVQRWMAGQRGQRGLLIALWVVVGVGAWATAYAYAHDLPQRWGMPQGTARGLHLLNRVLALGLAALLHAVFRPAVPARMPAGGWRRVLMATIGGAVLYAGSVWFALQTLR